jgi:hypothetical protein
MSALPAPHIAYGDRGAAYEEIGHIAWALRTHSEVIERYAALNYLEGIELATKDGRDCLVRLIDLLKELRDA